MTTLTSPGLNGHPPAGPTRRRRAAAWLARAGHAAMARGRAVAGWRWAPALPGAAGILLCSMAAGGIVGEAAGWLFGVWSGTGLLGLLLLRVDHRLPLPRPER